MKVEKLLKILDDKFVDSYMDAIKTIGSTEEMKKILLNRFQIHRDERKQLKNTYTFIIILLTFCYTLIICLITLKKLIP